MQTLRWERVRAGQWRLVDEARAVWADVARYIDERTGKPALGGGRGIFAAPRFKATCRNPDMPYYPRGADAPVAYWVLGSTVAKAKHNIEAWLIRNSCAVENFTIARDGAPEPAIELTVAGLRAMQAYQGGA
jgi:hypothetical protein